MPPACCLAHDGLLDAVTLGEGDVGRVALADHKDVLQAGGEGLASGVAHVHNVEATQVAIAGGDNTNAACVVALRDHGLVADLELVHVSDLARGNVHAHSVQNACRGVRVANGAAVVGHNVRDALGRGLLLGHTAQLELG